jgi:hypothetical protein
VGYINQDDLDGKEKTAEIPMTDEDRKQMRSIDGASQSMIDTLYILLQRSVEDMTRLRDDKWDDIARRFGFSSMDDASTNGYTIVAQFTTKTFELRKRG